LFEQVKTEVKKMRRLEGSKVNGEQGKAGVKKIRRYEAKRIRG
jgi:hypothetical protein